MSIKMDVDSVLECGGCEDPEQHPHAFDCTRSGGPVRTWESLEEYIKEFPNAQHIWATLRHGHQLNRGHEWQGKLFQSVDGVISFERACC